MLDRSNPYFRQVELVVRVLPLVASKPCFALKGGTAINLFICDFPRLSVDIDLTCLPLDDRDDALRAIDDGLSRIADKIRRVIQGAKVTAASTATCFRSAVQGDDPARGQRGGAESNANPHDSVDQPAINGQP